MNKVINKYLVFGFFKTILNFILVFICLGVILNLFEEIEFFKNLNEDISTPIKLTFLYIPNLIVKLLPFIIFLSAMWFLLSIRSNKDLLSLKVFGYSNIKIILILSFSAFFLGLITIFAINPVTSVMIKTYEKTKAKYADDIDHLALINKNGVWIKEIINEDIRIITAGTMTENYLNDVTIYEIKNKNIISKRIEAKKVNIFNINWDLQEVTVYDFEGKDDLVKLIKYDNYQITSIYNLNKLQSLYKNLDTVSFIELINEYKDLNKKGYNSEVLNEKINIFLSLPVFLFLMVVLASIFTVGSVKSSQNLYYIFISIITCVVIYYFKDLSIALGQTNRISLTLAVWIPIVAIALYCSIGILQINEK